MTDTEFIKTNEYHRFREFCNACRDYRYIGLCYGPPGVGKTLSARHYTNWSNIETHSFRSEYATEPLNMIPESNSVFYTVSVVNSPGRIEQDIGRLRKSLRSYLMYEFRKEWDAVLGEARERDKKERKEFAFSRDWYTETLTLSEPTLSQLYSRYSEEEQKIKDPTNLILVDESDRLKMAGLEQLRDMFDKEQFGLILIGMPGIEKRLARYPQLYSRIGFVHEFRPLGQEELRQLLRSDWRPSNISFPDKITLDKTAIASVMRITGGNFRLLHRLLAQIVRIAEINELNIIDSDAVQAARESLVIGT